MGEDIGAVILLLFMWGFMFLVAFGALGWICALFSGGPKHPGFGPGPVDLTKLHPEMFTEEEAREYREELRRREKEFIKNLGRHR